MLKRFHTYDCLALLGDKPMRQVYRATSASQEQVVLKIFDAACLNHDYDHTSFIDRSAFIKSIQHEHLVPIIDIGINDGQLYVSTPYVSADSLFSRLQQKPLEPWEPLKALELARQIGQALSYMHSCGIVHGNIKPQNILFTVEEKVMLTDFSMSGLIDENRLGYKSDNDSICYMAPEQDLEQSEQSDQYALACVIYELLTGRTPFEGQDFAVVQLQQTTRHPLAPSRLVAGLSPQLDQALLQALSREPVERFSSLRAFLEALQVIASSLATAGTQPSLRSDEGQHDEQGREKLTGNVQENGQGDRIVASSPERKTSSAQDENLAALAKLQLLQARKAPTFPFDVIVAPDKKNPASSARNESEELETQSAVEPLQSATVPATGVNNVEEHDKQVLPVDMGQSITLAGDTAKKTDLSVQPSQFQKGQKKSSVPPVKKEWRIMAQKKLSAFFPSARYTHLLLAGMLLCTFASVLLNLSYFRGQQQPLVESVQSQETVPTATLPDSPPTGRTIWLQATTNDLYVSARLEDKDIPVRASAHGVSTWEHFEVIDAGNGMIVLRDFVNGYYVTVASSETNTPLRANSVQPDENAYFFWIDMGDGTISLQVRSNGRYITVSRTEEYNPLFANGTLRQAAERFRWGEVKTE